MSLSFNHHGVTEITERVEIGRNFGYFFSSISNNLSVLSDSVVNYAAAAAWDPSFFFGSSTSSAIP